MRILSIGTRPCFWMPRDRNIICCSVTQKPKREIFFITCSLLNNLEFYFKEVRILVSYLITFWFYSLPDSFKTRTGDPSFCFGRCLICLGKRRTSVTIGSSAGSNNHEFVFKTLRNGELTSLFPLKTIRVKRVTLKKYYVFRLWSHTADDAAVAWRKKNMAAYWRDG